MRVLQVARYGTVRGGAETYVAALSDGLRAAGHEVALAYGTEPDLDREEVQAGFHVPGLVEPTAEISEDDAAVLGRAIDEFRPDAVHVHVADVPWVAPYVRGRAPALLAVHDHKLNCPTGTKYWAATRKACSVRPGMWCLGFNVTHHCGSLRANATLRPYRGWRAAHGAVGDVPLQVFSGFMRDLIARAGVDAARIAVTHYPVPPRAEAVAPSGPRDPRPVVFASGRLNKEKGFFELLEAMSYVAEPAHVVIAGEGHERRSLERHARSIGGPHRVTFTGWLDAHELQGWRERAVIVAVPSMWPEPFGIVGLEAMDARKPVVAFASGGIPEWCADGETGRLIAPGDLRALAAAIEDLLRDADARTRMGDAAIARAATDFSLAAHVGRVLELYEKVSA